MIDEKAFAELIFLLCNEMMKSGINDIAAFKRYQDSLTWKSDQKLELVKRLWRFFDSILELQQILPVDNCEEAQAGISRVRDKALAIVKSAEALAKN